MVAQPFADSLRDLVREFGGRVTVEAAEGQGPYGAPLYEFSWGHTRLHINRTHPDIMFTIGLYLDPDAVGAIGRTFERLGASCGMHFEVKRFDGQLGFQGMPLFPYRDEQQIADMMRGLAGDGAQVANNHTFTVKEGGMKPVDGEDAAFKRAMDPYDLMNPGKLTFEPAAEESTGADLPSAGWKFRERIN
jgi:hypothetical protein